MLFYHFTILSQVAGLGARTKSSNEIKRNPLTVTNYPPQPRRTSETGFIILASKTFIKSLFDKTLVSVPEVEPLLGF